jgi:hypothetical protein
MEALHLQHIHNIGAVSFVQRFHVAGCSELLSSRSCVNHRRVERGIMLPCIMMAGLSKIAPLDTSLSSTTTSASRLREEALARSKARGGAGRFAILLLPQVESGLEATAQG